jgi:nucleotide-binding universal stress UspA family protein
LLVTVWEPGLGAVAIGSPDAFGVSTPPPDPVTMAAVDRLQHEHASRVAGEGAELARSLALDAEAQAVPDEVDVADTLLQIARERDAAVVVVASHGISGLRSRVLGSVARKLIEHGDQPVLVIRASEG